MCRTDVWIFITQFFIESFYHPVSVPSNTYSSDTISQALLDIRASPSQTLSTGT